MRGLATGAFDLDPLFDPDDVIITVRDAARGAITDPNRIQRPGVTWAMQTALLRQDEGGDAARDEYVTEVLLAVRKKDGRVAWDVRRFEHNGEDWDPRGVPDAWALPKALPFTQFGPRGRKEAMRTRAAALSEWARARVRSVAERCPCTDEDLVAIDTLLESGSPMERPKIERLAIACRRGGGVLEGLKLRRRKK